MAQSKLDSLNRKISAQVSGAEGSEVASARAKKDTVLKYQTYLLDKKAFKVVFTSSTPDGSFSTYDNGVLVVLPSENASFNGKELNKYSSARLLNLELTLRVKTVDEEENTVICELANTENARESIQGAIHREIRKKLDEGEHPVVWGKIVHVTDKRVFVSILNQGVRGICSTINWQQSYTRTMFGQCEEGEFYQFEIVRQAQKLSDKPTAWLLSRRALTGSAWDKIDFSNLVVGGNIVVKCVEKPVGKSYWWGVSDRLPGIDIMGDYTERFKKDGQLMENITYLCNIKEISVDDPEKKNAFKVIPFDIVGGAERVAAHMRNNKHKEV